MLNKTQINEIREHLEKAQNPLFLFDNDPDGLCSFLLLQRYIQRGKGFPIRSFPALTKDYVKRAEELNADYIFILDKAVISEEFFKKIDQINLPVVWIDHHKPQVKIPEFINYYNPYCNVPMGIEPVSTLCYQITEKKEDMWIAVAGSIYDYFIPDCYLEFHKNYPDLTLSTKNPFEIYIKSEIGKIARIFSHALKDKTTNVIKMLKFLMKVKTPYEVLEEVPANSLMHKRFMEIDQKYQRLLEKAKIIGNKTNCDKILFFQYGGDLSISGEIANQLSYLFPKKIIVVAYVSGVKVNISGRGDNVREYILKAIKELEDSTGGGHEKAVGAQIKVEDLKQFQSNLKEINII